MHGPEQYIFRLYRMNIIAKFREQHPAVPFIFTVSREQLKTDCAHFNLISTIDRSREWVYKRPGCNQNNYVNQYARDHGHLINCLGCEFYKSSGREVTQAMSNGDLDKKTKRKLRREARKKLRDTH